jgi:biotin carboxyl carrier protein
MKYFVRIDGEEHEVSVDGGTVAVDGQEQRVHMEDVAGAPVQLVFVDNAVRRVVSRRGPGRGAYTITIDGYRFEVEALDERTRAIRELSGASKRAAGPTHLAAPMPGLIVRVNVGEGDEVRPGQGLVVMEAMKMENELRASAAGRVKRVLVAPGSTVEKGAILLEMESPDDM